MVDSYTGNHLKDGFTSLKTIRRLLFVNGRRSHSGFEGEAFESERRLAPSWEFGQQWHAIIVGGKEMDFRNFIYSEDDDDLAFLPKEPSQNLRKLAFGSSSSYAVRAKASASKDDAPILSISDNDERIFLVHLVLSKEFDQNPIGLVLREKISSLTADVKEHKEAKKARLEAVKASLCREVEELKQDRRDVVLKLVPYAAMKLVHSDELVRLVGTCPLSLFMDVAEPLIKALLSKKPPMLQNHAPSRTQTVVPYSKKATPSSAPSLNLMYPPADLVKPSPSLFK
nr:hypothetical protein [Tanacetum cinerariifolium]